jgi:hypothetical protein
VTVPADLPYSDVGFTTCGMGNDDMSTCLGSYDGGEDVFYEITVTATTTVEVTLDPNGTTYTGIAIDDACPVHSSTCLDESTSSSSSAPHSVCQTLDPGTYYVFIDTWPSPTCIPDFDLSIDSVGSCS